MAALSVLMSIYVKEKTEYVEECFKSLLRQTVQADEWVVVEDGPLTDDMYELLNRYQTENPGLIKRIKLNENQGLGEALRIGVKECKNELIARMDTDDIARPDRFERQLEMFSSDPSLDICGSHIKEFFGCVDNVLSERRVPIGDNNIRLYQKRRDAFNHMTVMYKKAAVIRAGNYKKCLLMEDTLLWVNMILTGSKCENIDDFLVYARTGKDMFERRGGYLYFKKYKSGRKEVYQTGYISWWDYIYTIFVQFVVAILPNKVRGYIYTSILRK